MHLYPIKALTTKSYRIGTVKTYTRVPPPSSVTKPTSHSYDVIKPSPLGDNRGCESSPIRKKLREKTKLQNKAKLRNKTNLLEYISGPSWFKRQRQKSVAGIVFDLKYPIHARNPPGEPSSTEIFRLDKRRRENDPEWLRSEEILETRFGSAREMDEAAWREELGGDDIQVQEGTILPQLPEGLPLVWDDWRELGDSPILTDEDGLGQHDFLRDEFAILLNDAFKIIDAQRTWPGLSRKFKTRVEALFEIRELQELIQGMAQGKMRGKVDGAVRTSWRSAIAGIFEVKAATTGVVDKGTATVADRQVRHRAYSCQLNNTNNELVIL
jgi:hypothetical protein